MEAVQLRQKVTVAGELTGTAEEIARERDELRREMEERKDEHTLVRNDLPFPFVSKIGGRVHAFLHMDLARLLLGSARSRYTRT